MGIGTQSVRIGGTLCTPHGTTLHFWRGPCARTALPASLHASCSPHVVGLGHCGWAAWPAAAAGRSASCCWLTPAALPFESRAMHGETAWSAAPATCMQMLRPPRPPSTRVCAHTHMRARACTPTHAHPPASMLSRHTPGTHGVYLPATAMHAPQVPCVHGACERGRRPRQDSRDGAE